MTARGLRLLIPPVLPKRLTAAGAAETLSAETVDARGGSAAGSCSAGGQGVLIIAYSSIFFRADALKPRRDKLFYVFENAFILFKILVLIW